jgi:hydrogenase expression/formation protein HypC
MCLTAPARVLDIDGETALVEIDGRRRRASLLLVPDARPGDWLLVGAGTALRRLDEAEALDLVDLIAAAVAATDGHVPAPEAPRGARS